jgi:uncharacterized protein
MTQHKEILRFSAPTRKKLGHYVYALVDPRDDKIFYVGKANANDRPFDHLRTNGDQEKARRIRMIKRSGHRPVVEILRYGLKSAAECFQVEAAIIDTVGLENLTNRIRGHGVAFGRQKATEVERLYGAKPVRVEDLEEPCILFFINETYSPTMNEGEVYDCVRQFWTKVSENTRQPSPKTRKLPFPTALAIVDGVIVKAYSIAGWYPAGTTLSSRKLGRSARRDKWEWVGQLISNHPLVGRRLTENDEKLRGAQRGFRYLGSTTV